VPTDQNYGIVDNGEKRLDRAETSKTKQKGIFTAGTGLKWKS
jgi:hypothetical protein